MTADEVHRAVARLLEALAAMQCLQIERLRRLETCIIEMERYRARRRDRRTIR